MDIAAEIAQLLSLSARIGRDPLLVQASSGNTSIKLEGTLWIKASGTWLAHAAEGHTLVPLDLSELHTRLAASNDFSGPGAWVEGTYLRASIETAMHAMLPQRVVIHVHSVNTISWAVRTDAQARLTALLAGMRWAWIAYTSSGLPLARLIAAACETAPGTNVFVLANHGLVVCADTCAEAADLLAAVERRLAAPVRGNARWDCGLLSRLETHSQWKLPESEDLHTLATDPVSRRILAGGILYPCQAMFLGTKVASMPDCLFLPDGVDQFEHERDVPAFGIIEGRGIVTNRRMTASQRAVLNGLLQVVQRIDQTAGIRYLSDTEVLTLLNEDAHNYQLCTERNAVPGDQRTKAPASLPASDHLLS